MSSSASAVNFLIFLTSWVGRGCVLRAVAGVNDRLLASSQPESAEFVNMSSCVPHRPFGDRVSDVVAIPDHYVLGVKTGVAAPVGPWESKYTL